MGSCSLFCQIAVLFFVMVLAVLGFIKVCHLVLVQNVNEIAK